MTHSEAMRDGLIFIAKWAIAGLAFALVLVWIRPDLRRPEPAPAPPDEPVAQVAQPTPATPAAMPSTPVRSYADAVARSSPSVVNIYTARVVAQKSSASEMDRLHGERWPAVQRRVEASLGSGVLIDAQGHIVTNNHVVAAATGIRIQLADGRIAEEVAVVGRDPETDLAVLRIKLDKLPVMALGRSDKLRVGDVVLAIGNPYGLSQTVTLGIVSATGRDQLGLSDFESFVQTDAAMNLGNSGGALVNTDGELIGINAGVLGQSAGVEGIGFAIPVNLVRGVVEQILKYGHVRRGWLGVSGASIAPDHAKLLGLPPDVGVTLLEVYADGPAAKAGLRPGDVLTALNGSPVHTDLEARNKVAALAPGRNLRIEARRGAEKIDVRVKVEERQVETASKN